MNATKHTQGDGFPATICQCHFAGTVCVRELDHDGRHSDTIRAHNVDEDDIDRARNAMRALMTKPDYEFTF